MINKLHINRLILPIIVAISIIMPGFASSTTFAMSPMDDMGHSTTDYVSCISEHQVPVVPAAKELDQIKNEDDETTPPESPYFMGLSQQYAKPNKQETNLITSSSFRPPDIVILTANLRI